MFVYDRFENDPIWVQMLQHDLYGGIVSLPFELARESYLKGERTVGIETQLGIDCRKKQHIDHRILQFFHDAIAAKFRFKTKNDLIMQSPITLEGCSFEDVIKQRWLHFYNKQVEALLDDHPDLLRQILIACTYPNPDKRGIDAEENIYKFCIWLNSEYF